MANTFVLPLSLHSAQEHGSGTCQSFRLDLTNATEYLDLCIQCSPLVLRSAQRDEPRAERTSHASSGTFGFAHASDGEAASAEQMCIRVSRVDFHYASRFVSVASACKHRRFRRSGARLDRYGPRPFQLAYANHTTLSVGEVRPLLSNSTALRCAALVRLWLTATAHRCLSV